MVPSAGCYFFLLFHMQNQILQTKFVSNQMFVSNQFMNNKFTSMAAPSHSNYHASFMIGKSRLLVLVMLW